MARDPDTIQREIEQARDSLAATVDELSVKANPKRLADGAKTAARTKLDDPKVRYPLIGGGVLIALLLLRKLLR
ncbi:uncharacterized protein DUF3618 [Tamaricihabitans halophyticus]|uniref:Uncharacterized protein DUF3618 n=1 Tax=Tamaricihabitans halophyticus TaxID=1262583 RepID=A0A4R2QCM5_9PSEU|nr:DUF3618 domain-containing protein [Tamaricihabitans halophyticus]TCP46792.1 uncharacterized protein DUF3618 [Tamaricihabitans halophyticus]